MITKRQAIKDDQVDRSSIHYSIKAVMRRNSRYAFQLAAQFA